jgi:glycerol-3-phosphate acyltransferase PlsY
VILRGLRFPEAAGRETGLLEARLFHYIHRMDWLAYGLALLGAYFLGSIPSGYLAGRLKGIDIRQAGSGNIGATNTFRTLGKTAGIAVLLGDACKGFVACRWLAPWIYSWVGQPAHAFPVPVPLAAGVAAILGHNYTCWLRFKGGKGIATSAGVFIALAWQALLATLAGWILVFALSRYVSLASITAALLLPVMVWFWGGSAVLAGITVFLSLMALYKHRSNIQRLLAGTEPRFGRKKNQP